MAAKKPARKAPEKRMPMMEYATSSDAGCWWPPRYAPIETTEREPDECSFCHNPRYTDDSGGCLSCGAPLSKEETHVMLPPNVTYRFHEEFTLWERIQNILNKWRP